MMNRKIAWLTVALAACFHLGVQAQPTNSESSEVRGAVQSWAPGARVVQVNGKTYTLNKDVQVIDKNATLLKHSAVRPGLSVQLLMFQGMVTHVVVNPDLNNAMDLPQ